MTARRSLAFATLVLCATPGAATADVIPDGVISIDHELRVEGQDDFPDMHFVLFPIMSGFHVLEGDDEDLQFKFTPRLYAVPKATELPDSRDRFDYTPFFEQEDLARTEVEVVVMNFVPDDSPVRRMRTVYRIDAIEGQRIHVTKTEETWGADDVQIARTVESFPPKPHADAGATDAPATTASAEPANSPPATEPDSGGLCALTSPTSAWPLAGLSGLALVALLLLSARRRT